MMGLNGNILTDNVEPFCVGIDKFQILINNPYLLIPAPIHSSETLNLLPRS